MFQRSNSSSNIPLPKVNLFGSKNSRCSIPKARNRSQSTSRLSQRDSGLSIPQLRIQRNSSLERKSSIAGSQRITPQVKPRIRSGSLQRTTPTSAISQRTSNSRLTTPLSCRKEYVTIQKLSNDKKWVSEQYIKVQNFIISSNLFDMDVVTANNIRPPSMNTFIYVTGILLMEIFPRIKISKENYKEVIPVQLKALRYPGTFANSVLKTVNTIHSWPQVIGMWSWLIDKVTFGMASNDPALLEQMEQGERMKFLLKQSVLDFLIKRHNIFNKSDSDCSDEHIQEINEEYVRALAEFHEVDFDKFKQLQDDVQNLKEYGSKLAQDVEQLEAENTKVSAEIEEMKQEIEGFHENDAIEEPELEKEVQLLQSNLEETREGVESTQASISGLREAIKQQPCTHQEKLALLRQTEELKKDVQMKREKIERAREIKNKFDHKLTTEICKIQSLVVQWNSALLEVSINKPHLKKLLLREKGFHDPRFLEELQEMSDYKDVVENEVKEALTKTENDLKAKLEEKREAEREIEEISEAICRIDNEYSEVGERVTEIQMGIRKVKKDLEAQNLIHVQKVKELQDADASDEQVETIAELKRKKEHLEKEVKKFGPKILSFFVEMHNQVATNLTEMEKIKTSLGERIENRQRDKVEKQRQIIDILKSFHF